jgi:hypothetical protein
MSFKTVSLGVKYDLKPAKASLNTGKVYGSFGLEPEQGEKVYVEPFEIGVTEGMIVSFIGNIWFG